MFQTTNQLLEIEAFKKWDISIVELLFNLQLNLSISTKNGSFHKFQSKKKPNRFEVICCNEKEQEMLSILDPNCFGWDENLSIWFSGGYLSELQP